MIILFGGSFDPIHSGHLAVARQVFETFKPTELRFLPCGQHAFSKPIQASASDRLAMLTRALMDEPSPFLIENDDIQKEATSYTIDTLKQVRKTLLPNESLAFIIGQDLLPHLDEWKEWKHLLNYAHLIVVSRKNDLPLHPALSDYVAQHTTSDYKHLKDTPAGKIYFLDIPLVNLSSSEIRAQLALGKIPDGVLPEKVRAYIRKHSLYIIGR
jgi:nicotinate-nucleotide adenylyltransferase